MTLSPIVQTQLIAAVRETATQEVKPRFRALRQDDMRQKGDPTDLVTVADLAMEAALRDAISRILPEAKVLGEEGVAEDPDQLNLITEAEQVIVIDPIDGTWNFAHNLATFGTLLAVVENGQTIFGLLYDVMLDDWIWAAKGQGAWFGSRRLSLPPVANLDQITGILCAHGLTQDEWLRVAAQFHRFGKIKDIGASIWDYRMLAMGHAAFRLNRYNNVWDHAAGVLCLQEAGGHAALLDGTAYHPTMRDGRVLAAQSEQLWDELAQIFAPLLG